MVLQFSVIRVRINLKNEKKNNGKDVVLTEFNNFLALCLIVSAWGLCVCPQFSHVQYKSEIGIFFSSKSTFVEMLPFSGQ